MSVIIQLVNSIHKLTKILLLKILLQNVTGFWITNQIVTLSLFRFIGPANGYTCIPHIHSAIARLVWLFCFCRVSFADPVNFGLRQWDSRRALHGRHVSEIHLSDRRRLLCHSSMFGWLALLRLITSPNRLNGEFNPLRLPTHPLHLPLFPSHLPCHQWYYSFEKSCSKSSSVS